MANAQQRRKKYSSYGKTTNNMDKRVKSPKSNVQNCQSQTNLQPHFKKDFDEGVKEGFCLGCLISLLLLFILILIVLIGIGIVIF